MLASLEAPAATDSPEEHADWLELLALASADRSSSLQELVSAVRQTGTAEEMPEADPDDPDADRGAELTEPLAEGAFAELSGRQRACSAGRPGYPFSINPASIEGGRGYRTAPYTFLLLLSSFGRQAGPADVDALALFDELAGIAAREYLGGEAAGARYYLFGFPRRITPAGFLDAVADLCVQLEEGSPARTAPENEDEKDAKLDLVAWRPFSDGRPGKLVGFGQCATGRNWREKLTELQPIDFCHFALQQQLAVLPTRLFFTPFRLDARKWRRHAIRGGIVFDRCRVTAHIRNLPSDIRRRCATWNDHVLSSL
jgi:hypothetical protein